MSKGATQTRHRCKIDDEFARLSLPKVAVHLARLRIP